MFHLGSMSSTLDFGLTQFTGSYTLHSEVPETIAQQDEISRGIAVTEEEELDAQ